VCVRERDKESEDERLLPSSRVLAIIHQVPLTRESERVCVRERERETLRVCEREIESERLLPSSRNLAILQKVPPTRERESACVSVCV